MCTCMYVCLCVGVYECFSFCLLRHDTHTIASHTRHAHTYTLCPPLPKGMVDDRSRKRKLLAKKLDLVSLDAHGANGTDAGQGSSKRKNKQNKSKRQKVTRGDRSVNRSCSAKKNTSASVEMTNRKQNPKKKLERTEIEDMHDEDEEEEEEGDEDNSNSGSKEGTNEGTAVEEGVLEESVGINSKTDAPSRKKKKRPRVFLDIAVGKKAAGRVTIEVRV